uniref:Uncharacterized protein n=1 Tax=Arundo donax TaxID=35708 RepID=A0A0A8ZWV0_ARUDO
MIIKYLYYYCVCFEQIAWNSIRFY